MIHVELDHIYSEDDAVRQIREIIDSVDRSKEPVVITRSNKPRVVVIDIEHIEELTGKKVTPVTPMAPVMVPSPNAEPLPTPAEPMVAMASATPVVEPASSLPDLPASEVSAEVSAPTMNLPTYTPPAIPEPEVASAGMPISTPAAEPVAAAPAPVTPASTEEKPHMDESIQERPFDPTNSSPLA